MIYSISQTDNHWIIRRSQDYNTNNFQSVGGIRSDIFKWLHNTLGDNWHCIHNEIVSPDYFHTGETMQCCDIYVPTREDVIMFLLTWEDNADAHILAINR